MGRFRFAVRRLSRRPASSAVIAFTLAVGLGTMTLVFSVIDAVLLEPLPYPEPERIVRVSQIGGQGGYSRVSDPNFADLDARSRSFSAFAQLATWTQPVVGAEGAASVGVALVSRELFDVVGVHPAHGRGFVPDEQRLNGSPAAVVSHGYWQTQLGGAADLAGRTLTIGDRVHAIVGVMPAGFAFPDGADVWTPLELRPPASSRTAHNYEAIGRLRADVPLAQARDELSAIARELKAVHGDDTWMEDVAVVPLHESVVGAVRPALAVIAGAVLFLFVIACANAGSLLLARAVASGREYAVRAALGAGRRHLAAHVLAEVLVLSLAGGAGGALLALGGVEALAALDTGVLPRADRIGVDWRTLGFALGLSGLVAASLSALVVWRVSERGAGLDGNRPGIAGARRSWLADGLVSTQVAMALVLLVGAALLGRSFLRLVDVDPGFRTSGLVFMSVSAPVPDDRRALAPLVSFYDELLSELGALPGVEDVGGITAPPFAMGGWNGRFVELAYPDEIRDFDDFAAAGSDPARTMDAEYRIASAGYFRALDIPLLRGRLFERADGPDAAHVAVVSRSLAEARWPGEDPLGKLIQFGNMDGDLTPFTVVGVVGDVRELGLERDARPTVYGYYRQRYRALASFSIAVRTPNAANVVPAAREIAQRSNPNLPVEFRTSESLFAAAVGRRLFNLAMLGAFGAAAVVLALAGVYGALAFNVVQRTREIGVRMSHGATGADIARLILGRCLWLSGAGVAAGLALSAGGAELVAALLYGIRPHDASTYALSAAALLAAACLAAVVPAFRAARIEPLAALRDE